MLSDASMARIALLLSITGFAVLLFFSEIPEKATVAEALLSDGKKTIEITARISWVKQSGNSVLFELDDGNKITALLPGEKSGQLSSLRANWLVSATGNISGKKGNKKLIVKEVRALD